ncbi:MAG: cytochrome P450 [Kiritimatiellae bacterium]|nr:cytochrome P450 [Kiritimatiellia bacterium]
MSDLRDPFKNDREINGLHHVDVDGENIALVLGLKDIRKTAKDWKTFSSSNPLMCVLHSEAHVRGVRQLPLEIDPPEHTDYRKLIEPLFRRPKDDPDYIANMEVLVDDIVEQAIAKGELEAVRELALPLQCRALTRLLQMPEAESERWISWGVHVFHDRDDGGEDGGDEGHLLESYTKEQFAKAEENPDKDFFSLLNDVDFNGRKLSLEEKQGFANVTFAGGRDTVINTVSTIFAYLGENSEALDFLRQDERRLVTATEEFVRFVSPVTALTRTCPHETKLKDHTVPAGGRIGLCWPSANRDASVFDKPDEVVLDRSPNPHVGFGFATHNCLGASHARLIIRSLLKSLCEKVERVELIEAVPKVEEESTFSRQSGYESVNVRLIAKQ